MPAVSINLCCYNSQAYLEETLASVFAQTCPDWELVVVNDGSSDRTDEIIRGHMARGRSSAATPRKRGPRAARGGPRAFFGRVHRDPGPRRRLGATKLRSADSL